MNFPVRWLLGCLAVVAATLPAPAVATLVSFQEGVSPSPSYTHHAVYIRQTAAATNQNNDGDREVIIGIANSGDRLRGLFSFDLSEIETAAGGNPVTIDSVQLVLTSRGGLAGSGSSMTMDVHQYDFEFDEAVTTWGTPGVGDGTAGGTIGTLLTSSTFNPSPINTPQTLPDSAAFQSSVASALAGDNVLRLLLKDSSETATKFFRAADETNLTISARPRLDVTYTVVPEPSSLVMIAIGMIALGVVCVRRRLANAASTAS